MRLQDAVVVQGRPVADLDEVPLEQAGRVCIDATADPRPEQPEVPGKQRRALKRRERQRCRKELVERVHELQPPDERAPERAHKGPVTSYGQPLRERDRSDHHAAAGPVNQRQQAQHGAQTDAVPKPERGRDHGGRDENEPSRWQRDAQDFDGGAREHELSRRIISSLFLEAGAGLATRKKQRGRAEPRGAGLRTLAVERWSEREDTHERSVAELYAPRNHGAVANKGAAAQAGSRYRQPAALDAACAERRLIGDRAPVPDLKQVGRHRGGCRKLNETPELRAERAVPRRDVERRSKRCDRVEAEREELVHHPVPHIKPAMHRVRPRADPANEEPLEDNHLGRNEKDK